MLNILVEKLLLLLIFAFHTVKTKITFFLFLLVIAFIESKMEAKSGQLNCSKWLHRNNGTSREYHAIK